MIKKHLQYSDDDTVYAWWEVSDGFFMPITGRWLREFSFLRYIWLVIKGGTLCLLFFNAFMFCLIWGFNGWDDAIDTFVAFYTGLWEFTKATWDFIKFMWNWLMELQKK